MMILKATELQLMITTTTLSLYPQQVYKSVLKNMNMTAKADFARSQTATTRQTESQKSKTKMVTVPYLLMNIRINLMVLTLAKYAMKVV